MDTKTLPRPMYPISIVYSAEQRDRLEALRIRRQSVRGDYKPESFSEITRKAVDIGLAQLEAQLPPK